MECDRCHAIYYFYHGLGGFVSSFQDSGTIIRRVAETTPPDADGVTVLKNTSRRSLGNELGRGIGRHGETWANTINFRNYGAVPSCVLDIFASA